MEIFTKLCRQLSEEEIREIRRALDSITERIAPAYANHDGDNALQVLFSLHQITSDELWHRILADKPISSIPMPSSEDEQEGGGAPVPAAATPPTKGEGGNAQTTATSSTEGTATTATASEESASEETTTSNYSQNTTALC